MNYSLSALYVGDLHPEVTESMLVEEFSSAGHVHSVRVCRKWNNDVSLNYAFVNFYKQADAERALATLNFKLLMGWPMRVMWSRRDSTLRKSGVGNLFIRNLDMTTIDSMTLFDLFSVFGNVLSCKVVAYKTGTKGYGYVQFESPEAANVAKERLDGKLFNDHKVSIEHFKSCKERKAEGNYHTQFHLQPAPAQAPDVVEKPAPAKVPAVEEKQAQVPAVEKKTAQAPAVEKKTAQAPAVEKKPAPAKAPAVEEKPGQVPAVEEKPASFQVQTLTEVPSASDVPMAPSPQKRLTIYMLESADFEMQIQMAHDHLLPLVEKIHPNDADKISWLLVQSENNFNIINMIADPDVLHAKVDKMDMFLKAGEAGVKPETLKMFFGTKKKRNKKKRRNNN